MKAELTDGKIILPSYRQRKAPRFGREKGDGLMVATDPPSQHVTKYHGCPRGCTCPKHQLDAERTRKLMVECRQFREQAQHNAPWNKRRAG